jgi:hypothetical protein
MFACVALGVLALTCPAQEKLPPPQEKSVEKSPVTEVPLAPAADCGHTCPGFKVLWVEKEVPIQRLEPREVVTLVRRPATVVADRVVKRAVTDVVLQPREVLKEVTCTTMQPCTETDPHTGHCTTVFKPVTECKVVKETVYVAVPVTREVDVTEPYLKQAEEIVEQKTVLWEYRTVMQKRGYPVAVPAGEVLKERWFVAPPCPQPEQACDGGH